MNITMKTLLTVVGLLSWLAWSGLSRASNSPSPESQSQSLFLQITPSHAYDWDGQQAAKFTYFIRGITAYPIICTGWVYPILQYYRDEWPMRRSCRASDFSTITETWGGRIPLPYTGDYIAFVELYQDFESIPSRPAIVMQRTFRVLEGNPR